MLSLSLLSGVRRLSLGECIRSSNAYLKRYSTAFPRSFSTSVGDSSTTVDVNEVATVEKNAVRRPRRKFNITVDLVGSPLPNSKIDFEEFKKQFRKDARLVCTRVIKRRIASAPSLEGHRDFLLDILLTDDNHITQLNKEYLKHDYATDVLSFWNEDLFNQISYDNEESDPLPFVALGDLVISLDTAERQANEKGHTLMDESRILLIHGLLHLVGYDHERGPEAHAAMAAEERYLMRQLRWTGQGLIDVADANAKKMTAPVLNVPGNKKDDGGHSE